MKPFFTVLAGLILLNTTIAFGQVGALDTTYGQGGKVETYLNAVSEANAEALQSDGKIVVAGFTYDSIKYVFATARYNTDGSVDTNFGVEGIDTISFTNGNNIATSVAIQKNGKILVAGFATEGLAAKDSIVKSYIIRYNTDGSLDTTFGTKGIVTDSVGRTNDTIFAITILPNGKILAAGGTKITGGADITLLRYDSTGVPDVAFNDSGSVATSVGAGTYSFARALAIQNNGKIVIVGTAQVSGIDNVVVARYDTNGVIDNSFNLTGFALERLFYMYGYAVTLLNDTSIIVGGVSFRKSNVISEFALMRFDSSGALDDSFGIMNPNRTQINIGKYDDEIRGLAIDSSGKLLVAGFTETNALQYHFALIRYNINDSLNYFTCLPDNTFGVDTIDTINKVYYADITGFGDANSYANAILIQHDDKIVLAGSALVGTKGLLALARYNIDTIHMVEGIDFVAEKNSMLIYPNPIQTDATLQYTLKNDETLSIKIYDALGRMVQSVVTNEEQPAGGYTESLHLEALPSGLYIVNLSNSKSQSLSIKIIKQ